MCVPWGHLISKQVPSFQVSVLHGFFGLFYAFMGHMAIVRHILVLHFLHSILLCPVCIDCILLCPVRIHCILLCVVCIHYERHGYLISMLPSYYW